MEAASGELRSSRGRRRRQAFAIHMGEVDTALLEHPSVLDHPRAAAASRRALPGVLAESGAAIRGGQGATQALLEVEQVGLDVIESRVGQRSLRMG